MQDGELVDGIVTVKILWLNNGDHNARALATYPNPRVRLGVTLNGITTEHIIPIPAGGQGTITYPLTDVPADTPLFAFPAEVISTEWDSDVYGGVLPTGRGHAFLD